MKKILSLLLICIMLSCSLAGCGSDGDDIRFKTIGTNTFFIIDGTDTDYLFVDIKYKTQYWYNDTGSYEGGLTLLVDSEGKPLLYEGEIPYYGSEVGK